jgi:hypothetical protein
MRGFQGFAGKYLGLLNQHDGSEVLTSRKSIISRPFPSARPSVGPREADEPADQRNEC